jgi:hypothetical protein
MHAPSRCQVDARTLLPAVCMLTPTYVVSSTFLHTNSSINVDPRSFSFLHGRVRSSIFAFYSNPQ